MAGVDGALTALEGSGLASWVAGSDYGYYITLSAHAVGLAVAAGVIVPVLLHAFGGLRDLPSSAAARLMTIAAIGLLINLLSGVALFSVEAGRFFHSGAFRVKMLLVVLAVVAVLGLRAAILRGPGGPAPAPPVRLLAGAVAALSLAVIAAGRLIAYIDQGY